MGKFTASDVSWDPKFAKNGLSCGNVVNGQCEIYRSDSVDGNDKPATWIRCVITLPLTDALLSIGGHPIVSPSGPELSFLSVLAVALMLFLAALEPFVTELLFLLVLRPFVATVDTAFPPLFREKNTYDRGKYSVSSFGRVFILESSSSRAIDWLTRLRLMLLRLRQFESATMQLYEKLDCGAVNDSRFAWQRWRSLAF